MGFFDVPPAPEGEEEEDSTDEGEPAAFWLGGVVPIEEVIGRSDRAAIVVRRIVAFEDGIELELVIWVRKPIRRRRSRSFPSEILLDQFPFDIRDNDGKLVPAFVRFGVLFPDGAKVTNFDDRQAPSPDATEPMHGISASGGGGSSSGPQSAQAEQLFWIWPIPETGDLTLVCEWPAYDIRESRLTINGDVIRDAAARSLPVWPDPTGSPLRRPGRGPRAQPCSSGRIPQSPTPDPSWFEGEAADDKATD